jgi:hypothetical protein
MGAVEGQPAGTTGLTLRKKMGERCRGVSPRWLLDPDCLALDMVTPPALLS